MNNSIDQSYYFNNNTENSISHFQFSYIQGLAVCLAIVFVLTLILNTISVVMIVKTKKIQPIKILILNLAIADIIYTLGLVYIFKSFKSTNYIVD